MTYYELEPEDNIFKIISVQTTYKCQMSCANCYLGDMLNNDSYPDVDADRLTAFMKRLPSRVNMRFIGAEPTMNPKLPELIKSVRASGHRPDMLTNGLKLRRLPYVKELKESGIYSLGLSMNGGLDDEVYKEFDNGKYAKQKMEALDNCMNVGIIPHINIIIDPTNIHVIPDLIEYVNDVAGRYNRKFGARFPAAIRFKSIGKLGTFRDTYTYSLNEMIDVMSSIHGYDIRPDLNFHIDGYDESNTCVYPLQLSNGPLYIKLTDWSVDNDEHIPDPGSKRRGILTYDYKIAPFFEYYENEHKHIA